MFSPFMLSLKIEGLATLSDGIAMKSQTRGVLSLHVTAGGTLKGCPHDNATWDAMITATAKTNQAVTAAALCADPVAPFAYMMGFDQPYVTSLNGVFTATNWQPTDKMAMDLDLPKELAESYKTLFEATRATALDSAPRFGVEEQ